MRHTQWPQVMHPFSIFTDLSGKPSPRGYYSHGQALAQMPQRVHEFSLIVISPMRSSPPVSFHQPSYGR